MVDFWSACLDHTLHYSFVFYKINCMWMWYLLVKDWVGMGLVVFVNDFLHLLIAESVVVWVVFSSFVLGYSLEFVPKE